MTGESTERRAAEALRRQQVNLGMLRRRLGKAVEIERYRRREDAVALVDALGAAVEELGEVAALVGRIVDQVTTDEPVRAEVTTTADDMTRHGRRLREVAPRIAFLLAVLADDDKDWQP